MPAPKSWPEIFEKVRELAAAQVNADPAMITEQTSFLADLNYDSLDVVEFIMEVEDAFDLAVPDVEAQEVRTVGDVVEMLYKSQGPAPPDQT
ncbi:MAG: acyl carrier protein [Phycisphaerae bacterium]